MVYSLYTKINSVWAVGLNVYNWSLEAGGSITQAVNGIEDGLDQLQQRDGYDFLKDGMSLSSYGEKITDNNQDAVRFAKIGEGQPDYYYCNFPGFTGKFYINKENGEIHFISKTAQVTVTKGSNAWTVTTLDGNKFHFTIVETVASPTTVECVGYIWRLAKIQLHTGREINLPIPRGITNLIPLARIGMPLSLGSG